MKTPYVKSAALSLAGVMILAVSGCSSKEEAQPPKPVQGACVIANVEAPDWACGTYDDPKAYTAVGSAPMSKLGAGFTRREAIASARSSLAQQIETDVKDKVETFMRSTGIAAGETGDKVVTQVSKQTARITMAGSKQIAYWENSGDGSIYVLVSVPKDQVYKSAKNTVSSSFKNDDALWQQFQSKQALEGLDKEFPTH